ncbi:MAG: hypothetical protein WD069_21650, partial [Planctomycetales bacterium]
MNPLRTLRQLPRTFNLNSEPFVRMLFPAGGQQIGFENIAKSLRECIQMGSIVRHASQVRHLPLRKLFDDFILCLGRQPRCILPPATPHNCMQQFNNASSPESVGSFWSPMGN